MKNLLIVESPTKERTIKKFLPSSFTVASSYGHVRDLPARSFGINIEKNFAPEYVWIPKSRKNIERLKRLVDSASQVYLATDFDREGEAIAWHLVEGLNIKEDKAKRITFHEITKEAILNALKHPRTIDISLVNAQQSRRILDRIVGYKLSPLLWKKISGGLSAGRVQSVALRLIVEREAEIKNFKSENYWTIDALLRKKDSQADFKAQLVKINGEKIEKEISYQLFAGPYKVKTTVLVDETQLSKHLKAMSGGKFIVDKIEKKSQKRSPLPPYTTSTLQQDASRRLGFYAKKTMSVAQSLYEGVSIGGGETVGLITYMRTDSFNIAASAQSEALAFIKQNYGKNYVPVKPTQYKTKSKGAQEAHEAIRPTSVKRTPSDLEKHLSREQFLLYDLIWKRFVASQMSNAVFDTVSVDIKSGDYLFRANGRVMTFDGFLKVYESDEDKSVPLPPLEENEELELVELLPEKHATSAPPRYNEASLIKILEEYGIGRPSTYATIISTIMNRKYVEIDDRRFIPTAIGVAVTDFLKTHFADIVDLNFTASAEEDLDLIAEGKKEWTKVMEKFYEGFSKSLGRAEGVKSVKVKPIFTDEECPECKSKLVERTGRYGKFLACSAFPKCRYIKKEKSSSTAVLTDEECPECKSKLVERTGKYGKFLACSAFPKCKYIKNKKTKTEKK